MHLVQIFFDLPSSLLVWMLILYFLKVLTLEWLTVFPVCDPRPQISHTLLIIVSLKFKVQDSKFKIKVSLRNKLFMHSLTNLADTKTFNFAL